MQIAPPSSRLSVFTALSGIRAAWLSVFAYVLFGTYIGIGALAHDFGFSLVWVMLSTILVWAGPAQVILISALGAGAAPFEVAVAVGLSGVRLLPMVVTLLPVIRTPGNQDAEPAVAHASRRSACGSSQCNSHHNCRGTSGSLSVPALAAAT